MVRTNVPRGVRFLRRRKRLRQRDLGERAGVSREMVSRLERGQFGGMTIDSIDRIAAALGASMQIDLQWHGEQLGRLMDAAHASLQEATATTLARGGWIVRPEVSFNHFGDRGRVDVLAYHAPLHIVIVAEVKSALGDLQETIGRLDVKARVARVLARDLGWGDVVAVVPALVIGDTRTARRVVTRHSALFRRYDSRGRRALAWIRRASGPVPGGLLWFASIQDSRPVCAPRRESRPNRRDSHVP